MNKLSQTVCFTGHGPKDLPWDYDEQTPACKAFKKALKSAICKAINDGYTHFITGMAEGVDTYAAEIVLELNSSNPGITLECAIPCKTQSDRWSAESKSRYQKILNRASKITIISEFYSSWCMHKRNDYMLDSSNLVIAGFSGKESGGTAYTIKKAQNQSKQVVILDPFDFAKN